MLAALAWPHACDTPLWSVGTGVSTKGPSKLLLEGLGQGPLYPAFFLYRVLGSAGDWVDFLEEESGLSTGLSSDPAPCL